MDAYEKRHINTQRDTFRERTVAAYEAINALPQLASCRPDDAIRALTRSHLEITMRSNNGRPALEIDEFRQQQLAHSIISEYRAQTIDSKPRNIDIFVHAERIVPGSHEVAPLLSFLAEARAVRRNGGFVHYCPSALGMCGYTAGPVVTHVQTALYESSEDGVPRHFYQTPLFSAEAFEEDVRRLQSRGAKLTFGRGKPTFSANLIVQALASALPERPQFQPSSIGSLEVTDHDNTRAAARISTSCYGIFLAEIVRDKLGACQATASRTTR